MELENVKYDAFISYRHSPVDMFIAKSIHRRLESFKLPKSITEKKLCTKTKINRVFRDQDELPLADNLSDPIDNALSNTDFLIVICTPRLPQSKWCLKEITTFLKTHDRDHILVVLAEGEPQDSFSYELTHEKITTVDADGNTVVEEREIEPLAADVRGKSRHETEKLLDDATLRLCAAIFGLNYDDLRQRHKEQQTVRRIKTAVGVSVVSVAFATVCLILLTKIKTQNTQILEKNDQILEQNEQITAQNDTISKQYDEIQEKYQSAMVSCASELFSKGRRKDALYALVGSADEDSVSSDTEYMLSQIMYTYDVGEGYFANTTYENDNGIYDIMMSADGKHLIAIDKNGSVNIFDTETDEKIASIHNAVNYLDIFNYSVGKDCFYYVAEDGLHQYAISSEKNMIVAPEYSQVFSPSGGTGAISVADGVVRYHPENGVGNYELSLWDYTDMSDDADQTLFYADAYDFSDDGSTMAMYAYVGMNNVPYIFVLDVPTGTVRTAFETGNSVMNNIVAANDTIFISMAANNTNALVCSVDIDSASENWISSLSGDFCSELNYDDVSGRIVANDSTNVYVLDAMTGEVLDDEQLCGGAYGNTSIVKTSASGGTISVFSNDGSRYVLSADATSFADITFFTYISEPPSGIRVTDVAGCDGNLFFSIEHSASVMKYSRTTKGEKAGDFSQDEYNETVAQKSINYENHEFNVANSIMSPDEKYIFTLYVDGSLNISDKAGKKQNIIYNFEGELLDAEKIDDLDMYILHSYSYSYLLDKSMNIVARMRRFVRFEDNCFIITTGSELYKLPYTAPRELYLQAKDVLGDYECSEATKVKYGIR